MVHPEINSYSVIIVEVGKDRKEHDMFIGKIKDELHLLGWRPADCRAYFTENECTSLDLGKVLLPKGKNSLSEVTKGDILHVQTEDGKKRELDGVTYISKG